MPPRIEYYRLLPMPPPPIFTVEPPYEDPEILPAITPLPSISSQHPSTLTRVILAITTMSSLAITFLAHVIDGLIYLIIEAPRHAGFSLLVLLLSMHDGSQGGMP